MTEEARGDEKRREETRGGERRRTMYSVRWSRVWLRNFISAMMNFTFKRFSYSFAVLEIKKVHFNLIFFSANFNAVNMHGNVEG